MDGVRGRDFSEYKSEVKMSDLSCAKDEVFSRTFRVYYEDTDAGGRVYHANYLKFCERTRTDFVREVLGYRQSEHLQADQKGFVVTKLNAAFMAGAGLAKMTLKSHAFQLWCAAPVLKCTRKSAMLYGHHILCHALYHCLCKLCYRQARGHSKGLP